MQQPAVSIIVLELSIFLTSAEQLFDFIIHCSAGEKIYIIELKIETNNCVRFTEKVSEFFSSVFEWFEFFRGFRTINVKNYKNLSLL